MNRIICFLAIGMVWSLTLLPEKPAFAGAADYRNCTSNEMPLTVNLMGNAASTLPMGDFIPGSVKNGTVNINCDAAYSNNGSVCEGGSWALSPVTGSIIPTTTFGVYSYPGMPSGVGYAFIDSSGQPLPLDSYNRHSTGVPIKVGDQSIPLNFQLRRIDGTLEAGGVSIQMYLSCNGTEWANQSATQSTVTINATFTVVQQTCSAKDLTIVLPDVVRSDFRGVGSEAGSASTANLEFDCGELVKAHVSISDNLQLDNASNILTNTTGDGYARNVGVRLLKDGNPVELAAHRMFTSDVTTFALQNPEQSQRTLSIPLSAVYAQKGVPVTPGQVHAQAIVNIAYD